jgi:hypothetical protein
MRSKALKINGLLALVVTFGLSIAAVRTWGAQESSFDWLAANDEAFRLDPADYHAGRVFKPGDQAGNVHVDIEAQEPVTVQMAPAEQWSEAIRHPELLPRITFRCVREHVTKTTYVCDVASGRPMTLVIRDERNSEQTGVTAFRASLNDHGTVREFLSPNDIHIQYYRWACVENCNPPRFQWISELKESYELTPELKIYDGITAERDGEPFSIKINSPVPMTVAILPARVADELREKADNLDAVLGNRSCMEKSIRTAAFECTFDLADGPQSFIAVPEMGSKTPPNKKAEVEVIASKCVANCLTDPER